MKDVITFNLQNQLDYTFYMKNKHSVISVSLFSEYLLLISIIITFHSLFFYFSFFTDVSSFNYQLYFFYAEKQIHVKQHCLPSLKSPDGFFSYMMFVVTSCMHTIHIQIEFLALYFSCIINNTVDASHLKQLTVEGNRNSNVQRVVGDTCDIENWFLISH